MTRISNVANLLLCATSAAGTLAFQSAPASAITLIIPSTSVSATSSTGSSFTVTSDFAANDTISINASGTVDLANGGYTTNAAGVLTQQPSPIYGLSTGDSLTGPSSANFGSLLLGNSLLGFFQVFPTSSGTSSNLSINNVTLSSIFGSGLASGTVLDFVVNDNNYPDNAGAFIVSGSIDSATAIPEPFTIIGTLVGGTAAVRMRKKLQAVNK